MAWDIKDSEGRKVFSGVLDDSTLLTLYRLSNKGVFDLLYGFLKQGKESSVLLGERDGEKVAIKVHAVTAAKFRRIHPYIIGDERFRRIKKSRRAVIFAWCRKEFKNMKLAERCGVACPKPIAQMNNVLVMEFLGTDSEPAPRLCDTEPEDPEKMFETVVEFIRKLYRGGLVHGDLSAYNILVHRGEPYFIDFSQGVLTTHPNAGIFLERDIKNVCSYFGKDWEEVYSSVVS